jgi:hypothetical protein
MTFEGYGKFFLAPSPSYRGVATGGALGAERVPEFDRSVNPIQTRGADHAPQSQYCRSPRIQKAIYTSESYLCIAMQGGLDFKTSLTYVTEQNVDELLLKTN